MEGRYPCLGKAPFLTLGHGIGKGTLELHQFKPLNSSIVSANTSSFHTPDPVSGFGGADKHLFGIASAQGASTAERS